MASQSIQVSSKPNPFSHETTILITLKENADISLNYYLPTGTVLSSEIVRGNAGLNEIRPEVENWPEGLVLVGIKSGKDIQHYRLIHIKK
jgi:hypothetical protein